MEAKEAEIADRPAADPIAKGSDSDRVGEAEQYCLQAQFILNEIQANISVYGSNSAWSGAQPGDVELALKYINRSLEIWPDNPNYLNLKALLLMEGKGEREEGIKLMERAASLAPDNITIQDNLEKTKSQQCFIATAAFDPAAWQVATLRNWRDHSLLATNAGKLFVKAYYRVSPAVASRIRRNDAARSIIRAAINPVARFLRTKGH